jgi:hypothetical protein
MYTLNTRNELRSELGTSAGISIGPGSYRRASLYINAPPANLFQSSTALKWRV